MSEGVEGKHEEFEHSIKSEFISDEDLKTLKDENDQRIRIIVTQIKNIK